MGVLGVDVKAFVLEIKAVHAVMIKADVFMICAGFYRRLLHLCGQALLVVVGCWVE